MKRNESGKIIERFHTSWVRGTKRGKTAIHNQFKGLESEEEDLE
jgi:hypothetical protein